MGSLIGSRRDQFERLDLAARYRIRPVTEVYPLEEVNRVHERLQQQRVRFRAVPTTS